MHLLYKMQKSDEVDPMEEKRQFERFEINVPVRLEIPEWWAEQREFALEADNLSAGGVFMQLENRLSVGTRVKMEIVLRFDELVTDTDPDGALVIAVTGHIQRSEPEGTAICFHDDYDVVTSLDFLGKNESTH